MLDLFLQLLSAARIALGSGRVLDLEGFYVTATSNIGSPLLIGSKTNVRETLVRRVLQETQNQKLGIVSTMFWVGETGSGPSNTRSAWDGNYLTDRNRVYLVSWSDPRYTPGVVLKAQSNRIGVSQQTLTDFITACDCFRAALHKLSRFVD